MGSGALTIDGADASLTVRDGGNLNVGSSLSLTGGGSIDYEGGGLTAGQDLTIGTGGDINFATTELTAGRSIITAKDRLTVAGVDVTVNGGNVTAGLLDTTDGGKFAFKSGRLRSFGTGGTPAYTSTIGDLIVGVDDAATTDINEAFTVSVGTSSSLDLNEVVGIADGHTLEVRTGGFVKVRGVAATGTSQTGRLVTNGGSLWLNTQVVTFDPTDATNPLPDGTNGTTIRVFNNEQPGPPQGTATFTGGTFTVNGGGIDATSIVIEHADGGGTDRPDHRRRRQLHPRRRHALHTQHHAAEPRQQHARQLRLDQRHA